MNQQSRVGVTGATGLLGGAVLRALRENGVQAVGLDLLECQAEGIRRLDLLDANHTRDCLDGLSLVVHCGGVPRPGGVSPETLFRTNTMSTFNVVEAAVSCGVERIVYSSSYSSFGPPFHPSPLKPTAFPLVASELIQAQESYGLSKGIGELILDGAVRSGKLASAVSLRFPWVQSAATFGRDIVPIRGSKEAAAQNLWAYVDIRDAATAIVTALAGTVQGHQRYSVSAADTFMDLPTEQLLADSFPDAALTRRLPGFQSVLDTTQIRNDLGFEPQFSWRDYELGAQL